MIIFFIFNFFRRGGGRRGPGGFIYYGGGLGEAEAAVLEEGVDLVVEVLPAAAVPLEAAVLVEAGNNFIFNCY